MFENHVFATASMSEAGGQSAWTNGHLPVHPQSYTNDLSSTVSDKYRSPQADHQIKYCDGEVCRERAGLLYCSDTGGYDEHPNAVNNRQTRRGLHSSMSDQCDVSNLLRSALIPPVLIELSANDFIDPPGSMTYCSMRNLSAFDDHKFQEKWDVDKDVTTFLSSILALSNVTGKDNPLEDTHASYRDLRLEEPLLTSDFELELQHIRRRNTVVVSSTGVKPFRLEVEADATLKWPKKYLKLVLQTESEVVNGKLVVHKDVATLLRDVAIPEVLTRQEVEEACADGHKTQKPRHITPPLLPLSPPSSPFRIPQTIQNMELTSTPDDLIAIQAADLDRQIMAHEDDYEGDYRGMGDVSSTTLFDISDLTLFETPNLSSSSPTRRTGLYDLRPEVPLLPQEFIESPPTTTEPLTLPNSLLNLAPIPESDISMLDAEGPKEDLETFMSQVLMPFAESAIALSEHEKLAEFDTTMRMEVPIIHDRPPVAPWTTLVGDDTPASLLDTQRTLLRQIQKDYMRDISKWKGVSRLEKLLPWSAFPPRLGNVKPEETFDDGSASRYMKELEDSNDIDVTSLVSLIDGLRVLRDHTSDDGELEPEHFSEDDIDPVVKGLSYAPSYSERRKEPIRSGYFQHPQDALLTIAARPTPQSLELPLVTVQGLVAKPTVPLIHSTISAATPPISQKSPVLTQNAPLEPRLSMRALLVKRKVELDNSKPSKKLNTGRGSASPPEEKRATNTTFLHDLSNGNGLAGFLRTQGGLAESITIVPRPAALEIRPPSSAARAPDVPNTEIEGEPKPNPVPKVLQSDGIIQIVLSPQIFAKRAMVRQLQRLLPKLEPVERSSLHADDTTAKAGCTADADVTLSPSTGLVLTSLQKLKQRPLPGQTCFSGTREHVSAITVRYERLVVLVHDARPSPSLDDNDSTALGGFIAFASSLDTATQVFYVPGPDPELVNWIAAAISQHAVSSPQTRLLPEETTWERFLRVAGLNPFAAQMVLNQLKKPDADHDEMGETYGLPAFLRMSATQRVQRFGIVLGGSRVLRRVSGVVDARWFGVQ